MNKHLIRRLWVKFLLHILSSVTKLTNFYPLYHLVINPFVSKWGIMTIQFFSEKLKLKQIVLRGRARFEIAVTPLNLLQIIVKLTRFFVCLLMIILMSIQRSSFETEIVFKTIFKQRSIHSVYFGNVKSVKNFKFILAYILSFFSQRKSHLSNYQYWYLFCPRSL